MYRINNDNHTNLQSNVPYKQLPKWFQDAVTKNAVITFENNHIPFQSGTWKGGFWKDGYKAVVSLCLWGISYSKNNIIIGCKTKTTKEWEEWFKGTEVFTTQRDTPKFKEIHNAFLKAKMLQEFDNLKQ